MSTIDELKDQLAAALEELQEKERDLIMAAEYGQQLVEANARLQAQVESSTVVISGSGGGGDLGSEVAALKQRLRDTEKAADRQISALTRQNQTLTADLRNSLHEQKKAETEHAKLVRGLEEDLESLRQELVLQKSKESVHKEHSVNGSHVGATAAKDVDSLRDQTLEELQNTVASLTAAKKENEKTIKQTTAALQESVIRLHDQEDKLQAAAAMRQEFERRGTLIIQLKEQVEDLHLRIQEKSENDNEPLTPPTQPVNYNKDWEWTPWLESVKTKAWDRNLTGLREEVEELRTHRIEAYNKLKEQMDQAMVSFVDRLPETVKVGVGKVASAVGVPLSGVSVVPDRLTESSSEEKEDTLNIDTITNMFPHIPRVAIEKDLASTRSVRLTIENILNGLVAPQEEGSGLSWTVANPEE